MTEQRYILSDTTEAFERERLGLLQQIGNPLSARRLQAIDLAVAGAAFSVVATVPNCETVAR
jgi:hypothetical protein